MKKHYNASKNTTPRYRSIDPEHASIAERLFFSQAEKNQKAQRRGEKPGGEDGRAAAERLNSLRSNTAALRRRNSATASPAFLRAPSNPDGNGELKFAQRTTFGGASLKLGAGTKILPA